MIIHTHKEGYLLLHCLLYIGLATMLSFYVTKFAAIMLQEFLNQSKHTAATTRLTNAQSLLERFFWKLPPEKNNWICRHPDCLVWISDDQNNQHEGIFYKDSKIWHARGVYNTQTQQWIRPRRTVIAYGIDQCRWSLQTYKPIKKEDIRISSIRTELSAMVSQKKKETVSFTTPLGARVVHG